MKKQTIQIAKRFLLGNVLVAALFLTANASTGGKTITTSDKAEVKYTGTDKENLLSFNVKYSNPAGNTFNLTVLDANGELLFKSFYGDKQFDKTFKLPKFENGKYAFVIEDSKTSYKEKFAVSVTTEVIENVSVSKAN
ncbi:hypothetical protein GWC95_17685 [Sediminibacterium roseum]|uniref:Por secretion system C-terminal sorting domain-containing protein n=1 Tax=Sediminibacterium roseum TaxID=1978412 RepID=A0ABW9ZX71_9BACT|nr:hypothetical protein [Sediminibacterium roseum]NCI51761.1 hypothetical protein [Sediminibacterium roseum]